MPNFCSITLTPDHQAEAYLDEVEIVRDTQRLRVDGLVEEGLGVIMLHDPLKHLGQAAMLGVSMPDCGPRASQRRQHTDGGCRAKAHCSRDAA